MGARRAFGAVVTALALCAGACTVVVGDLRPPRCERTSDCDSTTRALGLQGSCRPYQCVQHRCVPAPRDHDDDGDVDHECNGTDCDDGNALVHSTTPNAEACDGLDNDCNGIVDDGVAPPAGGALVAPVRSLVAAAHAPLPAGRASLLYAQPDGTSFDALGSAVPATPSAPTPLATSSSRSVPDLTDLALVPGCPEEASCDAGEVAIGVTPDGSATIAASVSAVACPAGALRVGVIERAGASSRWVLRGPSARSNVFPGIDALAPPPSGLSPLQLSAGVDHACMVARVELVGRFARCWGANAAGQLGDGSTFDRAVPVVASVGVQMNVRDVVSVAAGARHSCARMSDGTVWCWGANDRGQAGNGSTSERAVPAAIAGLANVTQLVAGREHSCARLGDGTVWCWGANERGQLGDGSRTDRAAPVAVAGLTGVTTLSAGGQHTCAARAGGALCWGANSAGQLGEGSTSDRALPTAVQGLPAGAAPTQLAAGGAHTCALASDGSVRCWGDDASGQLGDGAHAPRSSAGVVPGLSTVLELAAGEAHTCARRAAETLCWGDNARGQLGDGGTTSRASPVQVALREPLVQIVAGGAFTCGTTDALVLRCWGDNAHGQLADGSLVPRRAPATAVDLCTGRARLASPPVSAPVAGAARPALALRTVSAPTGAPMRPPQGILAWTGAHTPTPAAPACSDVDAPVEAMGLWLEGPPASQPDVRWLTGTNSGTPQVLGTTRGATRPAVIALPAAPAGYVVAFGDAAGGLTLRALPLMDDPPPDTLGWRPTAALAPGPAVRLPGTDVPDHVVIAAGRVDADATSLGVAWHEGCGAAGRVMFVRVSAQPGATAPTLRVDEPVELATGGDDVAPAIAFVSQGLVTAMYTNAQGQTAGAVTGGWIVAWQQRTAAGATELWARRILALDGKPPQRDAPFRISTLDHAGDVSAPMLYAGARPDALRVAYFDATRRAIVGAPALCAGVP